MENIWIWYGIAVVLGYLLGCSNMAYYLSKARGIDLTKEGTGNLGTSNALIILGKKAALLVLTHDILKGVIAILLMKLMMQAMGFGGAAVAVAICAGGFAILGHMFPAFIKGSGKGFATYIGCALAIDFKWALLMVVLLLLAVLVTDYIVAGTFVTIGTVPIFLFVKGFLIAGALYTVISLIILYKHRTNIKHILEGTERTVKASLFKKKEN